MTAAHATTNDRDAGAASTLAADSQAAKVAAATDAIIDLFESGDLPEALAQIYLAGDVPSAKWSIGNRCIALRRGGHPDARGFRQWKQVGRTVKKGERALYILSPLTYRVNVVDEATGEEASEVRVRGFKPTAVFSLLQTEGADLEPQFIDRLPLRELAESWGIEIMTYPAEGTPYLGTFNHRPFDSANFITLGVANLSTWAHELAHAAEHRLGQLEGTELSKELVAEFTGAALLRILGHEQEADLGGAWTYIASHVLAENPEATREDIVTVVSRHLERIHAVLTYIMDEAGQLDLVQDTAAQPSEVPVLTVPASEPISPMAAPAPVPMRQLTLF